MIKQHNNITDVNVVLLCATKCSKRKIQVREYILNKLLKMINILWEYTIGCLPKMLNVSITNMHTLYTAAVRHLLG